ncbi:hypothetical protein BJ508DRAFT_310567 [Ascobolus immersus RN42]|uniref:Uncharacterized protein n=1 Tax=Ascobolus immersus RN42 TaxID=1160509 RepID=A0A3N4HYV9_ASCIM|nr:hypothetical protein BJ508DRAFT_310567 [Ascobolus immersus RN42]
MVVKKLVRANALFKARPESFPLDDHNKTVEVFFFVTDNGVDGLLDVILRDVQGPSTVAFGGLLGFWQLDNRHHSAVWQGSQRWQHGSKRFWAHCTNSARFFVLCRLRDCLSSSTRFLERPGTIKMLFSTSFSILGLFIGPLAKLDQRQYERVLELHGTNMMDKEAVRARGFHLRRARVHLSNENLLRLTPQDRDVIRKGVKAVPMPLP